jgi:transcriptional regulator with XRE-family HTH domain
MRPTVSPFGQTLRRLRLARGLTLAELGGDELTSAHISEVEHGKSAPSFGALQNLAERLSVHPSLLLTGSVGDEIAAAEALLRDAAERATDRRSGLLQLADEVAALRKRG